MHWRLPGACAVLMVLGACAHQPALSPPPTPAPSAPASRSVPLPPVAASAAPTPSPAVPAVPAPSAPLAASPATKPKSATDSATTAKYSRPGNLTPKPSSAAAGSGGQPTLDLKSLEQRLRDTKAIGVFAKLSLKNQVDDLLAGVKAFHEGRTNPPLSELRQSYESLLLKVISVLQSGDPQLASAVSASRDSIWELLCDPRKFAEIT